MGCHTPFNVPSDDSTAMRWHHLSGNAIYLIDLILGESSVHNILLPTFLNPIRQQLIHTILEEQSSIYTPGILHVPPAQGPRVSRCLPSDGLTMAWQRACKCLVWRAAAGPSSPSSAAMHVAHAFTGDHFGSLIAESRFLGADVKREPHDYRGLADSHRQAHQS